MKSKNKIIEFKRVINVQLSFIGTQVPDFSAKKLVSTICSIASVLTLLENY